ncbi:MAG: helix-hairpin-helix domain-containing protein [Candidatus Wallbacteria bacterium]|nr:helix-hairpin-helix domain-containing protein [Candidatus Wallbacteria bacterium]
MRTILVVLLCGALSGGIARAQGRVNVNWCTYSELLALPGVGPRLAEAILDEHAERGDFRGPDDLTRVKGIGVNLARKLAPLCEFETAATAPVAQPMVLGPVQLASNPRPRAAGPGQTVAVSKGRLQKPSKAAAPAARVDVNSAPAQELCRLPGIGPVLASRIADHRTRHGAFHGLQDLMHVKGLGRRALALQSAVTFGTAGH